MMRDESLSIERLRYISSTRGNRLHEPHFCKSTKLLQITEVSVQRVPGEAWDRSGYCFQPTFSEQLRAFREMHLQFRIVGCVGLCFACSVAVHICLCEGRWSCGGGRNTHHTCRPHPMWPAGA